MRRKATSAGASSASLDYLEHHVLHPPRARWSYAPVLPLFFGGYIRETTAALSAAVLPDIPVRVLVPHGRHGAPRACVRQLDGAHHQLAQRFPQGELIVVDDASHYLPIDRPDVIVATVREVLGLNSGRADSLK
ncbi:alpha/beta fold hydrolase [Mycobacterium sp.]|uniref:alpha/beta fold hydrolase n=1 Tax=Mycobacterium sp. TaxID=1785 RepID=UPI003F9637A0